ncbi:MAG TPA: class I SAM-dependent methyltransferase [Alphaproteobacteria bacterium]|jgi:SAM-dependent methyltransferase|nr:class I SAM-dependent methyltransferase [Alphaproteobacteria bacterium]
MNVWGSGYVTDVSYVHGVYREQTPGIIGFTGLVTGIATPDPDGPLTYCELGCGQGDLPNLLAAANADIEIHATDFNPAHIVGARSLAAQSGAKNVHFHDSSFAEFAADDRLPDFDVVTLHGIYSWISAENRQHIVKFLRRRLKPGGVIYISYNTMPGWATLLPLRRLLVDLAGGESGPTTDRADRALLQAQGVLDAEAAYFRVNPSVAETLQLMKNQNRNYLSHEYLNADWTPFYFADLAAELSEAKLTYLGSAHILDNIDAVNLSDVQQQFLGAVKEPIRAQALRDYFINQRFRRDVFVKGAVPLSPAAATERWLDMRFVLDGPRSDVGMTIRGAQSEVTLQEEVYEPLLDALAAGPSTVREMLADPKVDALGWPRLQQALAILVGSGQAHPARAAEGDSLRRPGATAFNRVMLDVARGSDAMPFMASPVTGGPVTLDRVSQLFLLATVEGQADAPAFVWDILKGSGAKLMKDGNPLEKDEENLAELRQLFAAFTDKQIPRLAAFGIVEMPDAKVKVEAA